MALNNFQGLICHQTQPNKTKPNMLILLFVHVRQSYIVIYAVFSSSVQDQSKVAVGSAKEKGCFFVHLSSIRTDGNSRVIFKNVRYKKN